MVENDVCQSTASQFQAIKQTQIETVKSNTHCIVVLVDSFLHLDTSEGAASQGLRSLFVQCASLCWLMGVRWCKRCWWDVSRRSASMPYSDFMIYSSARRRKWQDFACFDRLRTKIPHWEGCIFGLLIIFYVYIFLFLSWLSMAHSFFCIVLQLLCIAYYFFSFIF